MGQAAHKLHPAVECELLQKTRFDGHELRMWYQRFMEEYPSGEITKDHFTKENQHYSKFGDQLFWGHIFDMIDKEKRGTIFFSDWIMLLSCVNRGSRNEQLHLLWNLYDIDGDGNIEPTELSQILGFLAKVKHWDEGKSTNEVVAETFMKLDVDHDNTISYAEFVQGINNHPEVEKVLNILNEVFKGYKEVHVTPHSPAGGHKKPNSEQKRHSKGPA